MQTRLYSYIDGIVKRKKSHLIEIGGISNHVHLLLEVPNPDVFTELIKSIKCNSTTLMKSEFPEAKEFGWQDGYGSFTVSYSQINAVQKYIQNQEAHHKKQTYENEYLEFLDLHGIKADPKYIFD